MRENDNAAYKIDQDDEGAMDETRSQEAGSPFGEGGDPRFQAEAENAFGANNEATSWTAGQASSGSMVQGVIGGVLAAVAGGAAWAVLVVLTGYEIGYAAIGLGALSGIAVVLLSRGGSGTPFQAVAVLSSVLGICIGKYGYYFYYLKEAVTEEYGLEAAAAVQVLSPDVFRAFMMDAGSMLGGFDILWVVLAVITAWKIPSLKSPAPQD
jgi:hypothetical protein